MSSGWEIATAIATSIAAIASSLAAGAALWVTNLTRKEVRTSQEQVSVSNEARYDQQRPLLMPKSELEMAKGVVRNEGTGLALTLRGVFFGMHCGPDDPPTSIVVASLGPLRAGSELVFAMSESKLRIHGGSTLDEEGKYSFLPDPPDEAEKRDLVLPRVGRLTITYRDMFGRRHASIFEYRDKVGWEYVVFLSGIDRDILWTSPFLDLRPN
jgi:hypothetical protein